MHIFYLIPSSTQLSACSTCANMSQYKGLTYVCAFIDTVTIILCNEFYHHARPNVEILVC